MYLLAVVVLFWGLSWYAIALQVGDVYPLVSIAWRFGTAGIILVIWLTSRSRFKVPARALWLPVVLLGACLFGVNFVCFYYATLHVPSGLVSIVFAMAVFLNVLNQWLWQRTVPSYRILIGAAFGVSGIALVFAPSIFGSEVAVDSGVDQKIAMATGLGLALLGTWFFSAGNLISASLSRTTHLPSAIACAMLVGASGCAMLALLQGESLALPLDVVYIGALAYLSIGASVIAFIAYLTLVAREGAARASYATVLFPLVALGVSTFAESYQWSAVSFLGVGLALGGAAIVFVQIDRVTRSLVLRTISCRLIAACRRVRSANGKLLRKRA